MAGFPTAQNTNQQENQAISHINRISKIKTPNAANIIGQLIKPQIQNQPKTTAKPRKKP